MRIGSLQFRASGEGAQPRVASCYGVACYHTLKTQQAGAWYAAVCIFPLSPRLLNGPVLAASTRGQINAFRPSTEPRQTS